MSNRLPLWLLIALSGGIISICMGMRQSLGLFMRPMGAEIGITAAAFGFSIALQNMIWGLGQPFAGALADRHGPRAVLIVTASMFALGLVGLMNATSYPGGLVVAGVLLGLGTTGQGLLYGTISRAAPAERRSQLVGLVAAMGSIGTFVLAPLGGALLDGPGWRTAMDVFVGFAGGVGRLALP